MKYRGLTVALATILLFMFAITSCDVVTEESNLEESMDVVPDLKLVDGAENATMKVNKGEARNSYFSIELSNIEKNTVVNNGTMEAWCILYDKPLNSNGGLYEGVKLYNTFGDESFKPLNHFLNERYDLRKEYSQLTWKEEQVIIWSVMDKHNPFDLDNVDVSSLSRLHRNGEPIFDTNLVREILSKLENEKDSFVYKTGQVFAVAADNGAEYQTTILVGETMFAFGGAEGSFECALDMPRWGWVIEFDPETGNLIYDANEEPLNSTPFVAGAGGEVCSPYSHNGLVVGDLSVAYDDGYIDFNFKAADGHLFSDPHVWVGCSMQEVADLGGNPPASFYGINDLTGHSLTESEDTFVDETFSLDVSGLSCDGNYYISVHAGNE